MSESKISLSAVPPTGAPQDVVPTELVPLPSRGIVYPVESQLHQQQSIEIRSMTARDEDIITSKALLRSGKAISMLLRGCITNKGVDVDEMLAGDRNAALIGIRITGYGPDYSVSIVCPQCGDKGNRSVDLGKLPIKQFPEGEGPINPGINEFSFKLPSKRIVHFKLMTGNDEREMIQIVEQTRKSGLNEELITTRLKIQIISIDGTTDKNKLATLIRNMPALDSRALRTHIDKISPGVQMSVPFRCSSCDYEGEEVEVPIGTDFFWPRT